MSIQFPFVPNVPGVPPLASFSGTAAIVGSIQGTVLSVTSGLDVISSGMSLAGAGIAAGTMLTSGLTAIENGVGIASVNIAQTVGSISMLASGSLDLGSLGDSVTTALGGDSTSAVLGAGAPQWGIFDTAGEAVLIADSVVALEYKKDWHISDYPVEQGNFESYNKVRLPYETHVTLTRGGSEADRIEFLQTLETIADSLDLYDVVTPERTYTNASITHFDYRRSASGGVSLLTATVWLQEIRAEASSSLSQTVEPSGATQINGGTVQTTAPSTDAVQAFAGHGATGSW